MGNTIVNASMFVMLAGVTIILGLFNRIGPVETPVGMRRLGWGVIVAGVLIALTQSEPTRRDTGSPSEQTVE